jgi:putative oxidoreductase
LLTCGVGMITKLFATPFDRTLTLLRVVVGGVMLVHGSQKMLGLFGGPGYAATMGFFGQMGIPPFLAMIAIYTEFFASLLLIAGFLSRPSALGIIVLMVVAVAKVHLANGFFMNWAGTQRGEGFEYHILMVALSAAIVIRGAGAWSVDHWLAHRFAAQPTERRADRLRHAPVH